MRSALAVILEYAVSVAIAYGASWLLDIDPWNVIAGMALIVAIGAKHDIGRKGRGA
jgi:hypothetical protein